MAKAIAVGRKVTINSKRGSAFTEGKVTEIRPGKTGSWISVNVGDKKTPVMRSYRASELVVV